MHIFLLQYCIAGYFRDFGGQRYGTNFRCFYFLGLPNISYKPIANTAWVHARLCKLQKGCTRLTAASDKVYQLLTHGRWFSPGTPASSTTKTGRHDIAEILLKVALKHQKSHQANLCGIVAAILKMATVRNLSMSGINSGHHYLPTYQMLMISDNVEFLRYCGGHFENGDREKLFNVGNQFGTSLSIHI
jgi:hypothetical protein